MHRTLIVARMRAENAPDIANIFAESDDTELPHIIGVSRRTLFMFHNLYFHLVEADDDIQPTLYGTREHDLYKDINQKLGQFISPFDPNWKEPRDAMARPFYTWQPEK